MSHHTSTIRRICALLAVLAITLSAFTVIPLTASAATADVGLDFIGPEFSLKQQESDTCTLCAETSMLRYANYLMGKPYTHITERATRPYLWCEGAGIWHRASYGGVTVQSYSVQHMGQTELFNYLIDMLRKHPEGIVVYNSRDWHAVWLIGYVDGVFYCVDPSNSRPSGAIPLTSAARFSGGYWDIYRVWYIESPAVPAPHVCSSSSSASCTADKTCDGCGAVMQSKLGHNYVAKTTAPTCTAEGYTTHTCNRCGDSYTDSRVSVKGHTPAAIPAIPATCTESGKTEGSKCSVCGEILARQTTVAPLGHTEEILPAKEATCTEAGLTAGARCEVCGDTLISRKEIPAKGHTEVMDPAKAPTCTEAGLAEGKHCSVCGEVLTAQNVVLAIGHTPGDWATTVEPAVGTEGKRQQSCVTCGGILHEETIPALPEETEPITEPETDPVTEPDTDPTTHPEAETPPVTETPSADPATTEDPTAKEPSTAPTVTVGCSGSVLSCGLLMLVTLAGAVLIKRKE